MLKVIAGAWHPYLFCSSRREEALTDFRSEGWSLVTSTATTDQKQPHS
jgi:hypothetical protein